MKKIVTALVITMLCVLFVVGASAETYLKGDVNMDGKVNAADARIVLRAGASLDKISETQKLICDMNDDGRITAADARTVLRISAQLEDEKGEIIIGETPSDPEPVERTELLSGIGSSIEDFMKKFGGMRELDTNDNTISYTNDYVTVVSDPDMIHSGNISSISITGGEYMLCGVYAGMSADDALAMLKADKWIVKQEVASQIILTKIGMCIKIAVSDNTVTFVEYYLGTSVVNPGPSESTTKPSETTTQPPETTTQPPETTTQPPETTTKPPETTTQPPVSNDEFNKLPEQIKAYLSGNFGLKGSSFNKDSANENKKDAVSMFVTKDNVKAGMSMDMGDGTSMTVDVIVKNPSGSPKMYIVCRETKMFCEIDSLTMLLLQINPSDLKFGANSIDINKIKVTETTAREGNTIYTLYIIKTDTETCEVYMLGDDIKRIDTKDKAGNLQNRIDVDEFFMTVSDSEFSLNNYKKGSLLEIFGLSGDIGDLIGGKK